MSAKQKLSLLMMFATGCISLVFWLIISKYPETPRDFEECIAAVEMNVPPNERQATLLAYCGVTFAGRRKMGGGYTYHDFMQNRSFDIAGPNPSAQELKQIDHEYLFYLDAQRKDAVAALEAQRQNERAKANRETGQHYTESVGSVGAPMVITPANPTTLSVKGTKARLKKTRCDNGPLLCTWSKYAADFKDAFGIH